MERLHLNNPQTHLFLTFKEIIHLIFSIEQQGIKNYVFRIIIKVEVNFIMKVITSLPHLLLFLYRLLVIIICYLSLI